ncbi:MAG: matrixin family metalloprotease [Candidatus Nanoarchaeia archaeon]
MRWARAVLGFLSIFLVLGLLSLYWFDPFSSDQFLSTTPINSNFSINSSSQMQFYPNLRYPSPNISYNVDSSLCSLQRQDDMRRALSIIENATNLTFYQTNINPEISITCDNKIIVNKSYFIAGEGGPVNITQDGPFNVINEGQVLLLRDSNCPMPNIATHELLHALGFAHSSNPGNIMYPITSCDQTLGQDIPNLINNLYSIPTYPDLQFENVSAFVHGRYLDTNLTIVNYGLESSQLSEVIISADGNEISKSAVDPIDIGSGINFDFKNIFVPNIDTNEIEYTIHSNFTELNNSNKQVKLTINN